MPIQAIHTLRLSSGGLVVAAAGLLILAMGAAGIFPLAALATRAAGDGALSPEYAALLHHSQWTAGWTCLAAGLLARGLTALLDRLASLTRRRGALLVLAFLGALAAGYLQASWFDNLPHVTDATSHWFQARIFAQGEWTAPLPPCHEAFFQHNVVMNPRGTWHTKYFPGQALWLTPGMALGWPWLMMPLAWGLALAAILFSVQKAYDRTTAAVTGWLLLVSPMGLLLAASFMSHTTFLMAAALAAAAALIARDARSPAEARTASFAAGFAAGLAAIIRPQDLVVLAVLGAGAIACAPIAWWRAARPSLPWAALGILGPVLFLLGWNRELYGSWLASGYNFSGSASLTPIIRDSLGFHEGHTPQRAIQQAAWSLLRLNQALLGWPCSLPLLALLLLRRPDRRDLVAAAAIAATVGLYLLFPYLGVEYEARYYAPALPFLALLVARALQDPRSLGAGRGEAFRHARAALLGAFMAYAVWHYWPRYLAPRYRGAYEQVSPVLRETAQNAGLRHAIVLVPSDYPHNFRYSSGIVWNDPFFRDEVIYARDLPGLDVCLAHAFPDRRVVRFAPDENWQSGDFVPWRPSDADGRVVR